MLSTPNQLPTPGKRQPREPKQPAGGRIDNLDLSFLSHSSGATQSPALPGAAPASPGAADSGKIDNLDLNFLSSPPAVSTQAVPAASSPQIPHWTNAYREAVQDAAKANNVPVDLLLKVLSEGAIPDGQKLESIDPTVYTKNGVLGIYHAANFMGHILDKVGRNQSGYSKALDEYANEVNRRVSAGEFAPTTLGYLNQIHSSVQLSRPTPEEMFTGAMNSAYASDSHPEFPYPTKRPVPPEAAKGVNLLDAHRTLQAFSLVLNDLAAGTIEPFLPESGESVGQYLGRGWRHAEATWVADTSARQSGMYDNKILDILQRGSEAGLKYVASRAEGEGVIGALYNSLKTFLHSEPHDEYQADTNVSEEASYRNQLQAYERGLRNQLTVGDITTPSIMGQITKGTAPVDPATMSSGGKAVLDATIQTIFDPTNLLGSRPWKALFGSAEFLLHHLYVISLGPKALLKLGTHAVQQLGWHPEVIEKFGGPAGERMQRFFANMVAIAGRAFDYKAFARMVQETAPRLSEFADKTHEMEEEAARIAETDPVKAARLQRQVAKRREILAAPYSLRRMSEYAIKAHPVAGPTLEFMRQLVEDVGNQLLARWKAQVGLAELGIRKGFDWLDVFGHGKMAMAKSHAEDRQLATWATHQLSASFQGLDMKGEEAKNLFKALNGDSYDLDDAILKRRVQIYREVMDSILWLYGDKYARADLKILGFELPEALKNLDRGPRNLLTTEDAIRAARAGEIEDPEEAAAILKRAVARWNYIPFKHLMSSTLRLNPEEAETLFLNGGYQHITGVFLNTRDMRREVEDFFLKERPDLSIHAPEVHAAQSFARVKVAARLLAAKTLAEESERIAKHFGFSPEEEAWKNLFLDTYRANFISPVSGLAGTWAKLTQEKAWARGLDTIASTWKKFINFPLVRFFVNPLGHISNMTQLMLLNKPQLIPRAIELYLRQIGPDIGRAAVQTAQRAVKPESRAGQYLSGLAKKLTLGRYKDPKLRKFIDTYGTMGRYNGIQDFVTPQEFSVAKTTKDLATFAEKNIKLLGIGKGIAAPLHALSAGLNASSMVLWPFDEAIKSALMEHYVEAEKLPIGRAFARTLAETVDYSDPSMFAKVMRYVGWFATWHTKLPFVMLRLYMQNPRLFAILSRLDPKAFGQTYDYNGQQVERVTPVVTAWRDPLGTSKLSAPARFVTTVLVEATGGSNPYPDNLGEDFFESLGFPWEWARSWAGETVSQQQQAPETPWQWLERTAVRQPLLKEYPAPSASEQDWYWRRLLEIELGRNINFRPNTLRMPKR